MQRKPLMFGMMTLALVGPVVGAWSAPQAAPRVSAPPSATAKPEAVPVPDFPKIASAGVSRAVALLQSTAATFSKQRDCFSCHHNAMPALVVDAARRRGFGVDENAARSESANLARVLGMLRQPAMAAATDPKAEKMIDAITVDPMSTLGYGMAGFQAAGLAPSDATAALANYMARKQRPDGRWAALTARPPSEGSDVAATAWAIRALKHYGAPTRAAEYEVRIERARQWLATAPAKSAEDRAFKLLGLGWASASPTTVNAARDAVLAHQMDDGGWAQLDGTATDAYATGLSLYALREATGMAPDEPAYMKGYTYLLFRQRPDGSWLVSTRAQPVQPYFETGFPHKKDQFISTHATAWATLAILPAAEAPEAGSSTVGARQ